MINKKGVKIVIYLFAKLKSVFIFVTALEQWGDTQAANEGRL